MSNTRPKQQYFSGVRTALPVILGFIPVGIAYAIMARQAGFTGWETVLMSLTVFAGASQMMAVGMYGQGAGTIAIIFATFILNLRHLIMSTCVMNRLRDTKTGPKLLAAFGVTDETFAIFTTEKQERCSFLFFLGAVTVSYGSWVAGSAIGAVASQFLPDILTASLGISLYAMFLGLLVPNLTKNLRLALLVLLTAAVNWALNQWMDASWAMIASTLVCAAIGVFFVDLKEEEPADAS